MLNRRPVAMDAANSPAFALPGGNSVVHAAALACVVIDSVALIVDALR